MRRFAPGCALMLYKPELAARVGEYLKGLGVEEEHLVCCHFEPKLTEPTQIINTCPGCDKRYRDLYTNVRTLSLWEVLVECQDFPFPDYGGARMAILDACPTRNRESIHHSIRCLLDKMNITVVEPERTRTTGACCGDSYYGVLPVSEVKEQMKQRAAEMPEEDVVVYCVSCCNSMHIGGKRPRYLVDLLFGEETRVKTFEPEEWHRQIEEFMEAHKV